MKRVRGNPHFCGLFLVDLYQIPTIFSKFGEKSHPAYCRMKGKVQHFQKLLLEIAFKQKNVFTSIFIHRKF